MINLIGALLLDLAVEVLRAFVKRKLGRKQLPEKMEVENDEA